MGCRVCAHESRDEIDRAVEAGDELVEVAVRYGVTRAAIVKHGRCPRAPQGAAASRPRDVPAAPAPRRSPAPPPRRPSGERAPTSSGTDSEESPATSRSEEIRAARRRASARESAEDLLEQLRDLVADVQRDPDAGVAGKIAVLRAMTGSIRLLGTLTGELGASETSVARSPFYRRVRTALLEALRPFPDAARAVISALEQVEGAQAAEPSKEAAA